MINYILSPIKTPPLKITALLLKRRISQIGQLDDRVGYVLILDVGIVCSNSDIVCPLQYVGVGEAFWWIKFLTGKLKQLSKWIAKINRIIFKKLAYL